MMGRQRGDHSQLFYLFNLEGRVPANHLLRRINPVVTRVLTDLREKLAPFYSDINRAQHLSRFAMLTVVAERSVTSSSSQRRPRAIDATNVARVSDRIGRAP